MATIEQILMVKGPDVIVACPDTSVRDAVKLMSQANVGSVIVKDGSEVTGIFTERDVLRRVIAVGKDPDVTTLGEVMSSPVKSCRLDDRVHDAISVLTGGHFRHMAVIEDGALIGLVGLRDVMRAELLDREEQIETLKHQLAQPV